jgi:general secretion pathway protein A
MLSHRALLAAFAAERRRVTAADVRQAYREVSAVPLPGIRRRSRLVPLSIAAAAVLAAIAFGVRELAVPPPIAVAELPAAAEEAPAADLPDAAATPAADPIPTDDPAPDGVLANMTAPTAPLAPDPTTTTLPAPPALDQRLAQVDAPASLHTALVGIARTWGAEPPSDLERAEADFPRFGERRQLEHLPLTGNLAMLRLLDVPAILELRFPNLPDSRWVALVALTPERATLALDGEDVPIELAFLERYWYGRAHVFSRDFEGLGPGLLANDVRGLRVIRLQALLGRTGLYDGGETGTYGATTRAAVTAFQRSRYIEPDGQVGRLTRMVLYAAVGGYQRPTLAGGSS